MNSVRNPYEYAWNPYTNYVEKYLPKQVQVLLLGLNAGPNGMCVTGVLFGDYSFVTNWLGISGTVKRKDLTSGQIVDVPLAELSARREPSGTRLWTFIQDICKTPLEKACDDHLAHTMRYWGTDTVIAIGRYVEKRANVVINLLEN